MATMARIRALWEGWPGAPGYSNFYFDASAGTQTAYQEMANNIGGGFDLMTTLLPAGLTITIDPEVVIMDDSNGQMQNIVAIDSPDPSVGTSSGSYSGTSGALIRWVTATFKNGRQVRGHTYLVPLIGSVYSSDGSISGSALSTLETAALGMLGSAYDRLVWSRPTTSGGNNGSSAVITTAFIPDLAVVRRSRRT